MKKFLPVLLVVGLAACNNEAGVKNEADTLRKKMDTLYNEVKNSDVLDSLNSKGARLADSINAKGGRAWDSTKSKGGKLLNKAGKKISELKN